MPAYIGALVVGAVLRNIDDATGWLRLPHRAIDTIGAVTLSLFLAMALMTLNLLDPSTLVSDCCETLRTRAAPLMEPLT